MFDLQAPGPLPLSGTGSVRVRTCSPTSIHQFTQQGSCSEALSEGVEADMGEGEFTQQGPCSEAPSGDVEAAVAADCIVSWFEADLGEGGWISTGTSLSSSPSGHWVQSVQLLEEPLRLPHRDGAGRGWCRIETEYASDHVWMNGRVDA